MIPMLPALFVAVGNHEAAAVRRLLDDGADPNAWSPLHGQSLLFTACDVEDLALERMLLERGADPNQRLNLHASPYRSFDRDVTVLMFARTTAIAAALIEFGADVNAQAKDGTTALMNAAVWGRVEVLRVLLDCGAIATTRQNGRRKATALDLVQQQLTRLQTPFFPPDHPVVAERIRRYREIVSLLSTTFRYSTQ
jgi:ankyrin repeat protein